MSSSEHFTLRVDDADFSCTYERPDTPQATMIIAHGAGAGMNHPFLLGFSNAMNDAGFATLRFNFPYMEQGRRFPDRPPKAIAAWREVMAHAQELTPDGAVWACGKSFGGRMASMAAAEGMDAAGLIFLGYPLHPPGKPEKIRDEHLVRIEKPMLFLQGSNDAFARKELLDPVVAKLGERATLQYVPDADHSFAVKGAKRSPQDIGASLAPAVSSFIARSG
ncbi:alpha/beta hydrolase [Arthrobacter tumbae]|uniref:alpha/beta hydrolase family protein n=1 Tax=Arthrobacter tumbae TaxID=163874 RepID=UPI00195BB622|nr:alpha/beta family hydrolase [Arthrobacter tumbae]MBM7781137.1 putative alpha/beta-hydrolase family hydrolase [Arthrobacter tumbae]